MKHNIDEETLREYKAILGVCSALEGMSGWEGLLILIRVISTAILEQAASKEAQNILLGKVIAALKFSFHYYKEFSEENLEPATCVSCGKSTYKEKNKDKDVYCLNCIVSKSES